MTTNHTSTTLHYEDSILLHVPAQRIFEFADDHSRFSSHMNQSSWMMGGGRMSTETDEGRGQAVGSHIRMSGKVFGINLFLDEVITLREPPFRKTWKTVGTPKLLVIGNYEMGFEINEENGGSRFRVFINYELPEAARTRWLGNLFGGLYARWCVQQMIQGARDQFNHRMA
jgi:hypothetical protein